MAQYRCVVCEYIYDENQGGVAWNDMPEDWLCPVCGSPKKLYELVIEKKLGIRFKIIRLKNWDEVLEKARNRQIHMVTAATRTPQREKYLRFTSSFVELPAVIIVRQKVTQNLTMGNISGMKVAVVYRYAAHDFISNKYPDMDLNP